MQRASKKTAGWFGGAESATEGDLEDIERRAAAYLPYMRSRLHLL